MKQAPTIAEMMEAYALDAVDLAKQNFKTELDFSEESVRTVEWILGQYHDSLPKGLLQKLVKASPSPDTLDQVCKMFGAYLGEVIRRRFGGDWTFEDELSTGKRIMSLRNRDGRIWPPAKVYKRITNGPEDNVWHYYQAVTAEWSAVPQ